MANQGKNPPGKAWGVPQMKLLVDEHGQIISATHLNGNSLGDGDYDPTERRRIVGDAVIATENWCTWKKIGGQWR